MVGVDIVRPLWRVRVDPAQIERALGTIAAHAIDAMPDGGAVRFKTCNVEIGMTSPQARSFVGHGRYVRIDVSCVGLALDLEAQVRVFEPFFSAKKGSRDGMGLAAVFGLIKQSGGYIWLDSERAMETTFTVLLPAEAATDPPAAVAAAPPRATILVVDDDDEVRGLIVKILEHQGYSVLDAASADVGATLCEAHDVQLLVADVVLDGVRGDEFALSLMSTRPDLKLVCISGYPEARAIRTLKPARAVFLEKPFSAKTLVERVGELLDR
jgi:two-component system cell cycle sensor histidine kinase/response regulator CckA